MLLSVVWSQYFTVSHICRGVAVIINQKMWLSSIDSDSVQLDFIIRLLLDLFPRGEFLHDQWHYKTFQFALNWTHVMPQSHLYASLFLEKKGSDISLIWLVKKDKPCGHWTRHLWSAWLCRWTCSISWETVHTTCRWLLEVLHCLMQCYNKWQQRKEKLSWQEADSVATRSNCRKPHKLHWEEIGYDTQYKVYP